MIVLAGLVFGWVAVWHHRGEFSPDSYSYYDISRTFGTEFGRISTIRQYVTKSDYNCSFPYVWPFLIFLTDTLTGLGMASGTVLNCLLMLLTAVSFCAVSRHFSGSLLCGAVTAFLLFCNAGYLEEAYAGRSIPLAILLTTGAVSFSCEFFLTKPKKYSTVILIGMLAGLNAMTRFDEISILTFLVPVVFLSAESGKRLKSVLLYGISAGVFLFPWCVYCMKHFGTPYFSDNNGTIWQVTAQVPSYVFLPEAPVQTFWNAPAVWCRQMLQNTADTFRMAFSIAGNLLQMCLIFLIAGTYQSAKNVSEDLTIHKFFRILLPENRRLWYLTGAVCLYTTAKLLLYALVGYILPRYETEPVFLLCFVLLLMLYRQFPSGKTGILKLLVPAVLLLNSGRFTDRLTAGIKPDNSWIPELNTALTQNAESSSDSVLILGRMEGFSFGALTGWKTYVTPVNVSPETVDYLLSSYADADWIALDRTEFPEIHEMLSQRCQRTEYQAFFLYHISENGG